eukprot:jgi/Undpi1/2318/HiC_scaffold_13.g05701.m1
MPVEYEKVCPAGLFPLGLQHSSESVLSVFRVIATLVTVSIISSWYSREGVGSLMLLFLHWIGGLVHLLSGLVMAQMVLNCWVGEELLSVIKALKFLELAGSNLVAVTNLAICTNLAVIVHSHRTMSRVKSASSFRMVFCFLAISVGFAASALPFWDMWAVTGTSFQPTAQTLARNRWISISYFILEAVAGLMMSIIVVLLLLFRRLELREAWGLHGRIKFHVALTTIALMVNVAITVAGFLVIDDHTRFWLIILSWVLRYVHIALDTLVLYSALETPVIHLESSLPDSGSVSVYPHVALRC